MFIHRKAELEKLNNSYSSVNSALDIVYGAKNIGKTALVNEFTKDKACIYFSSYEMIPSHFFTHMVNCISKYFYGTNTVGKPFNSFEEVILFLLDQEIKEKLILVLDDFQAILKTDKQALDTLCKYWKKELKKKNIHIIISTSLQFLEYQAKNEIEAFTNNIIKLEYLDFFALKEFFPNINKLDLLYIYSLLGTTPANLKYYNPKIDFTENIVNLFISSNAYLFDYGIKVLKNEIAEVGTYCSILQAIAKGNKKIGDIAKYLDVKSTYLTRYLLKLSDMMVIKKIIPLGEEKNKNSKYGRYEITDNTLIFWFLYIYPNLSLLQQNKLEEVSQIIQEEFIKKTVFQSYKKCIKEIILDKQESIFGYLPKAIAPWWDNSDNTIDIVAHNNKVITFVQILWEDKDIAKIAYGKLKNTSEKFETSLEKKYIIVTKSTFFNMK
ncbi:MAG: ATP-binding protein [Campylobacteraceae bacterium]|nr:ATP-binding protein [Campylobacteraceae bacterium]